MATSEIYHDQHGELAIDSHFEAQADPLHLEAALAQLRELRAKGAKPAHDIKPDSPEMKRALNDHARVMSLGARCLECPMFGKDRGPVLRAPVRGPLTILTEKPDPQEVTDRQPMMGKSGKCTMEAVSRGGLSREEVTILSTVSCRPEDDYAVFHAKLKVEHQIAMREARREHVKAVKEAKLAGVEPPEYELPHLPLTPEEACYPRLKREMDEAVRLGTNTVLTLGAPALKAAAQVFDIPYGTSKKTAAGEAKIVSLSKMIGLSVKKNAETPVIIPTYHPGYAMRQGARIFMPVVKAHIERATRTAVNGGDTGWRPPEHMSIFPTVDEIEYFLHLYRTQSRLGFHDKRHRVICDIETDGINTRRAMIRCIGFAARVPARFLPDYVAIAAYDEDNWRTWPMSTICVPIRYKDTGAKWWSNRDDELRVISAVMGLVNDPEVDLTGHNFNTFDVAVMIARKLILDENRPYGCTLLKTKCSWSNDLPLNLGFTTGRFRVAPAWKNDANDKVTEGVDDRVLGQYCIYDCAETAKNDEELDREHITYSTLPAYQVDLALAPHFKNATDLGVRIDIKRHAEMWRELADERARRFKRLQRATWEATHGELKLDHVEQIEEFFPEASFNPGSNEEISDLLYAKAPRGKGIVPVIATKKGLAWKEGDDPSVNAVALTRVLSERHPDAQTERFINRLLEYRAVNKIVGTYVEGLVKPRRVKDGVCPKCKTDATWALYGVCPRCDTIVGDSTINREYIDGEWHYIIHPVYKQHIPTGRVACSPSIQVWPERGVANMRELGEAPEGHVYVSIDLDQIEFRIYVAVSGDRVGRKALDDGLDPHTLNYASMKAKNPKNESELMHVYNLVAAMEKRTDAPQGKPYDYWKHEWKKRRNIAKRFVFLIAYGGEADKLFETMKGDRDKATGELMFPGLLKSETDRWIENWHSSHPETAEWQKYARDSAKEAGYVATPMIDFRRRYFLGGIDKQNAPVNAVVQLSSGSVTNRGMLGICEKHKHRGYSRWSGVNLQVHDNVAGMLPERYAEEMARHYEKAMYYEYEGIKFTGTAKVGKRWSDV